jgi:DNA-binding transcriptional ArsR family regulator
MTARRDVAAVAALIGDRARAEILDALMGGKALPASELARRAGVSAQTVSAHLAKLRAARLLEVERFGRHRYFRVTNPSVAAAIEALSAIAPEKPVRSLHESDQAKMLALARLCYDHLAGYVGVAMADSMRKRGYITNGEREFEVRHLGRRWLQRFGIDVADLQKSRRNFGSCCLDWTELRPHIGGALGAALAKRCLDLQWFVRHPQYRGLKITALGMDGLTRSFSIKLQNL